MEFAVIKTGGKQYLASVGTTLKIEKLPGEYAAGDKVVFDEILLVDTGESTKVGTPTVAGAKVEAIFEKAGRAAKVMVLKYKQKSRYRKVNGHRQPFVQVKISAIKA